MTKILFICHGNICRSAMSEFIPYIRRQARQVTVSDYDEYDLLLCMEQYNIRNLKRIIPNDPKHKIHLLLDYTDNPGDISDPWYTDDFNTAYDDIVAGCTGLLTFLSRISSR